MKKIFIAVLTIRTTNDNIQKYLELSYSSSEVFFSNCGFDEQKELLILRLNGELENNLAVPCDIQN